MQIIKDITLDLNRGFSQSYIEVHQGDTGRYIRAKITQDGKVFEIPNTFSAYVDACFIDSCSDKRVTVAQDVPCEINPNEGDTSVVMIPITKCMSATVGKVEIDLKFVEGNSSVTAQTVRVVVLKKAVEGAEPEQSYEVELIDRVTKKAYTLYVSDGKLMLEQSEE